jgi:hypothetical protein
MRKFKERLSIPQALFASFFVATILTFVPDFIGLNNRIYLGIFAGITSLAGYAIARFLFKAEE